MNFLFHSLTFSLFHLRCRVGFWCGGRGRRRRIRFGTGFIGVAPVIRLVKAGTLEHDSCSAADQTTELVFTARRTFPERRVLDILEFLEFVRTSVTAVVVGRHRKKRVTGEKCEGQSPILPKCRKTSIRRAFGKTRIAKFSARQVTILVGIPPKLATLDSKLFILLAHSRPSQKKSSLILDFVPIVNYI